MKEQMQESISYHYANEGAFDMFEVFTKQERMEFEAHCIKCDIEGFKKKWGVDYKEIAEGN
jgi:hypothetical protein